MRNKKELTREEMADYAKWYFNKYFESYTEVAKTFSVQNSVITEIIQGKRAPTESMLIALGYYKAKVYKRVK